MITIVLPISRQDYLRPVVNSLKDLEHPEDTELLIILDGDFSLMEKVSKRACDLGYSRIQIINFGDSPAEDIDSRRYRISAIHNKARHYVPEDCDYVMLLEDDTTYPADTLTKLQVTMDTQNDCAFVEGVELGRWNTPYIGAWRTDNVNDPHEFLSVMPAHGVQEIDAGGLYCALVDADLYKMHQFEPYDKVGKMGLSCDVNFGLYLRQQGYKCYVDHSIQCDHIGDKGSVNLGNTTPRQVRFYKGIKGLWVGETL